LYYSLNLEAVAAIDQLMWWTTTRVWGQHCGEAAAFHVCFGVGIAHGLGGGAEHDSYLHLHLGFTTWVHYSSYLPCVAG
jgi:hypothetical protein